MAESFRSSGYHLHLLPGNLRALNNTRIERDEIEKRTQSEIPVTTHSKHRYGQEAGVVFALTSNTAHHFQTGVTGSWYEFKLRIPYDAIDMAQIAYNSRYFVWFEQARLEFCRSAGASMTHLIQRGLRPVIAEEKMRFLAPARLDDEIVVKVRVSNFGNSSMTFDGEIHKLPQPQLLCKGQAAIVFVDGTGKPTPIPPDVLKKYQLAGNQNK